MKPARAGEAAASVVVRPTAIASLELLGIWVLFRLFSEGCGAERPARLSTIVPAYQAYVPKRQTEPGPSNAAGGVNASDACRTDIVRRVK
jgi:hypothetical protein